MKNIKSKILSLAIVLFLVLSFGSLNTSIAQAVEAQPVCTLEQISGRTIVDLTPYDGLRSDSDEAAATGGPFIAELIAGTYDVTLQSYDNHTEKNQIQLNEQWYRILKDVGDNTIATTSAISDLPDDIDNLTEVVDTNFVLTSSITSATTYHYAYPDSTSANSIRPVCAAFDLIPPPTATIEATKIICPTEDLLPNWGAGGADITSTTANDFITANPTCYTEDWTFEWAPDGTVNPDDQTETGGEDWTAFTSSATVSTGALIWVREQFDNDYISFSGDTTEPQNQNVSAEFYCSNDVLNYDNYDFINPVEEGETYYCVGFNVPTETQNSCPVPDTLQDETEEEVNEAPDGEEDLQDILDSEGYGVDVQDDQKQYQLWNVDSGNEVTINAAFIAEYAGNNSVFGYYKDGDLNTFVGIFRTGDVPAPYDGLPLGTSGPFNVNTGGADTIGFAIKTYSGDSLAGTFATENALNPNSSDQVVVYNPEAGKYVLAFEDIEGEGSDYDYNDLVVEITLDCEDLETPPPPPPECSDNVDNADPEDELADELDPGCHTDGDANNENSYDPNDDDETDEAVEPPECSDNVDNSDPEDELADELDPGCHTDGNAGNSESYNPNDDNETDEVSGDLPECSDGSDNEGDSEIDEDDPGCHDDEDANNPDSYDPNDDDETDANDIPSGGGGGGSGGRSSRSSGQVLGAETPALCNWTVDTYMRRGYRNNAEQVKVLQEFLNWYMHSGLVVDGF